jgi:pyruvate/2-oxoglutarate dehydrogenase complex dihydrolipoamide dehydrogenase (E3) component
MDERTGTDQTAEIVVIGIGPGGEVVAGDLAKAGRSVIAVNESLVGGECPYWGCVPTKMMARAASALSEARRVDGLAGHATVTPDWSPVANRIREEATDHWDDKVAVDRLLDNGATFLRGRAQVTSPLTATVTAPDGTHTVIRATTALVLATGSQPAIPAIEGLAGTPFWTNHELVEATTLPESMVVLGGGAIGCELAQIAATFGVQITIVEPGERLLGAEEPESSAVLATVFGRAGIAVRTGVRAASVAYDGTFAVTLTDGSIVHGERLLLATGRRVDLAALGADALGVDPTDRTLRVDGHCHIIGADGPLPSTYALGDLVGQGAFTHVAVHQARVVRDVLLGKDVPADLGHVSVLPRVTFTDPEIGSVGLTEQQARAVYGGDIRVASASLAATASRAWIHGPGNDGWLKVIEHDGILIGATSAGPTGGEVLGALSVAVQGKIPVVELRRQVWAYPTMHRGIEDILAKLE